MISSQEFYQKLQAGQINEALTQVLFQANQLDITTQLTDEIKGDGLSLDQDSGGRHSPNSEYLRTKINLLTGEIHNEIGHCLIVNSPSYLRLQQLHIDQIIANHQIIQGHLRAVGQILAACPPGRSIDTLDSFPEPQESTITEVSPTRLTETFRAILASSFEERQQSNHQATFFADEPISEDLSLPPIANSSPKPISAPLAFDDDIDLSIDENEVEWEEWLEDRDLEPVAETQSPATVEIPPLTPEKPQSTPISIEAEIPEWSEDWVQAQPQLTTVKPTGSRATVTDKSINPSEQWDRFAPEHIGIYIDSKPTPLNSQDPHQVDRLLADLDNIRQHR